MRIFALRRLLLAVPMAGALAQTPALQRNVVYVCTDGQSFKAFSCDNTMGACDYQNYKKGQAYQRGEALRVQPAACLWQNATRERLPKRRPTLTAARFHPRLLRRARVPAVTVRDPHLQEIRRPSPEPADSRSTTRCAF